MLTSRVSRLCKRLDEKQNGPIYALVGPLMFHEFYKNSESSFSHKQLTKSVNFTLLLTKHFPDLMVVYSPRFRLLERPHTLALTI